MIPDGVNGVFAEGIEGIDKLLMSLLRVSKVPHLDHAIGAEFLHGFFKSRKTFWSVSDEAKVNVGDDAELERTWERLDRR